ncbi:helix-turn-helix domain-containing protein [Herbiconiux sp. VKM Ac-2851]|uniref:helix-turn-helix domain-containing protein n=1 Tax=Herbiconiux sp. VKM Ac-2851 TaxID=2739025 RepID=UPI001566524A|nr:helix-turn-helix transcriptional regulator [Herbiconiux sp. VKM Ac-2851]NQX34992.1 helix-turn-helix domain-containing protein [Herbiconiux sp. VKM Ac-2851]
MTARSSVLAQYLRARRSQLDPASFGLVDDGRRVPGLRREELASLAGISRDYYIRLEQGQNHQVSHQVLNSLAEALCLDPLERSYFYRIARPGFSPTPQRREPTPVSEAVLSLLNTWSDVPAFVEDSNLDVVAINEMADVLIPSVELFDGNLALAAFAKVDEERIHDIARRAVAALRFHGDPGNPRFQEVVGELSTTSAAFRRLWAQHDARPMSQGTILLVVGDGELVEFPWQVLEVPGGFFMTVWPVARGTRAFEVLAFLRVNALTGRGVRGPLRGWPAL